MKWIRLYTRVVDDPKVQLLPDRLFKHWINLLCLAGERDSPLLPGGLAAPWRCFPATEAARERPKRAREAAARCLVRLHKEGLLDIENGFYKIHNWEKYQYVSDSSTERVQRFRERSRNVTETVQSRAAAEQIRREESRSTESDLNSGGHPAQLPPSAAPLKELIPFAAAACAAAPNPARSQAEKALLSRADDIRAARNPEGLALVILQDFGIQPPQKPSQKSKNENDYDQLIAEIERSRGKRA